MQKRNRAWRRYKDYIKAKRKHEIDVHVNWWPIMYTSLFHHEALNNWRGRYDNLHQYSKNKIHCSCPMCRTKTNNKKSRFGPRENWSMRDERRIEEMDDQILDNE